MRTQQCWKMMQNLSVRFAKATKLSLQSTGISHKRKSETASAWQILRINHNLYLYKWWKEFLLLGDWNWTTVYSPKVPSLFSFIEDKIASNQQEREPYCYNMDSPSWAHHVVLGRLLLHIMRKFPMLLLVRAQGGLLKPLFLLRISGSIFFFFYPRHLKKQLFIWHDPNSASLQTSYTRALRKLNARRRKSSLV